MSFEEQSRRELIQDVIDRLITHPNYRKRLEALNAEFPTKFVTESGVRKEKK